MRASRGSVLLLVLALGCGGTRFTSGPGDDAQADASEAASASSIPDAIDDATDDAPDDATEEAGEHAIHDAGADTCAEAGAADGGGDATTTVEAGDDLGADASTDAAPDAATDSAPDAPADAIEACTPTVFYEDGDGDGYGGTTTWTGCTPPDAGGWVDVGGDCDDSKAQVNPGQTAYFDHGYVPTGQSTTSFDYNCDARETESGASAKAGCHPAGLSCGGSGYLEASPVRSGPGVDPFCGSDQAVTCSFMGLSCAAGAPQTASPIACH
jgi:hypothetical protein